MTMLFSSFMIVFVLLPNWAISRFKNRNSPNDGLPAKRRNISVLGSKYDLFEGIYGSADWKRLCQFLELDRTPICCAIPKNHPLCDHKQISMHDLDNQHIVTIPLDTDLTLPYGLTYANEPSEALKKFLRIVKKLTW